VNAGRAEAAAHWTRRAPRRLQKAAPTALSALRIAAHLGEGRVECPRRVDHRGWQSW